MFSCALRGEFVCERSPGSNVTTEGFLRSYGHHKRFLVSKLTVWRIIQKYKVHGTISHLSGTGRPFKLTH